VGNKLFLPVFIVSFATMERKNSGLKRKREATPEASASPVREGAWTTFYNLKIYCSALAFNPYHSDIFAAVGLNLV